MNHSRTLTRYGASAIYLAILLFFLVAAPAQAHGLLVRSDPTEGTRLRDGPSQVAAWFTEPLEASVSELRVLDGSGARVDVGGTRFDPADRIKMTVSLQERMGPGYYLVVWETLSRVDGHLWFGSFEFAVLNPDGSEPQGPRLSQPANSGSPGNEAESSIAKFLGLSGGALLAGGLAFFLLVSRPALADLRASADLRTRTRAARLLHLVAWPGVLMLVVGAVAELLLQASQLGGLDDISRVLGTAWGTGWLERFGLLLLLSAALADHRGRVAKDGGSAFVWLASFAALGYLLLVSRGSHAGAVLQGSVWAVAFDFLHLAAASVWIGGLAELALHLRWRREELPEDVRPIYLARMLRRFSLVAGGGVCLLLITGLLSALVHVPSFESLLDTTYGNLLLTKLVLVLPLLAVAGVNAWLLRPRFVRDASLGGNSLGRLQERLGRLVAIEAALGLVVLVVVGILVQYPTARSLGEVATAHRSQAQAAPYARTVQTSEGIAVKLEISPNAVGNNSFQVNLAPDPSKPMGQVNSVVVDLESLDPAGQTKHISLEPVSPGVYRASTQPLDQSGAWRATATIQRSQLTPITAGFRIAVQSSPSSPRGPFGYPLVVGDWATLIAACFLTVAILWWIFVGQSGREGLGWAKAASVVVSGAAVLVFILSLSSGGEGKASRTSSLEGFNAQIALRYQTQTGQFVLLEAEPFQLGENTFRITVLDANEEPMPSDSITLRFSRLDIEGSSEEVEARPLNGSDAFVAQHALAQKGWWALDVSIDENPAASFYVRLDNPSRAPAAFAPPDYAKDPSAEALFRSTVNAYQSLSGLTWQEELTSGNAGPGGLGVWILTQGEAQAPDKLHLNLSRPGVFEYDIYRVGDVSCSDSQGKWECLNGESEEPFDLDYQLPASAFRFGRRETLAGELNQILIFYNPSQSAWYAWWIGETTGHLNRQVMNAPGHFMLVNFFDHDAPHQIVMPPEALALNP